MAKDKISVWVRVLRLVPLAVLGAFAFMGVRSLVPDEVTGAVMGSIVVFFCCKELW